MSDEKINFSSEDLEAQLSAEKITTKLDITIYKTKIIRKRMEDIYNNLLKINGNLKHLSI